MSSEVIVSPSILSADAARFGEEIISVRDGGASWLHFDIMDGKFVPNLSYGPHIVKCLSNYGLFNDVHLMLADPIKYAPKFVSAGADLITFHYEAVSDILLAQQAIRDMKPGLKVGLSLKPRTPVEDILPYVNYFDLILVMSVEPGFGGQSYLPIATEKIEKLRQYIDEHKLSTLIEVDGGINQETISIVKKAGVDVVVTGSYLFQSDDRKATIDYIKGI